MLRANLSRTLRVRLPMIVPAYGGQETDCMSLPSATFARSTTGPSPTKATGSPGERGRVGSLEAAEGRGVSVSAGKSLHGTRVERVAGCGSLEGRRDPSAGMLPKARNAI